MTPDAGGPGLHERDIAVMVGEVKGILTQVLTQMTSLTERVHAVESQTNTRVGVLETQHAQMAANLAALVRQHSEDMARLARERADERDDAREEARQAAAQRPTWWQTLGGVAALITAVGGLLALGGVIYSQVRP